MNNINVISINPAQSAKGALHPEVFERIAREYRVNRDTAKINVSSKRAINFLFGINKGITTRQSAALFSTRSILGLGMTACGIISGITLTAFTPATMMVVLGVSLFSGLFTRLTSAAAMGVFGFFSAMSYLSGMMPDITVIASFAIALLFMVVGPGRFSIDQIMRQAMYKSAKRRARARAIKLAENRLSYRAIQYI